ncbi:MAG: tRNA (adenosine(37)-N6)-threonylcarbamoyltransferase complex dimerization subunit type 1 TsaB [Bacteroidetes bacterium]|nr:tRNA (adenosine(37)-N6)-threonylcarbamoyltransferase complex dimerization subunit type 1 TsaB [Bacteroidota bacterium]
MSFILNIDTALESAFVSIVKDGEVLQVAASNDQKDHAAWLHPAISSLAKQTGITLNRLNAVAVSIGPGSYTGLRVGLSAAKGFCYALDIPLIAIGTLQLLAASVQDKSVDLICPLIDARRMEVYAALYDKNVQEIKPPHARVLNEHSFMEWLNSQVVLFCGMGSKKLRPLQHHPNAFFIESVISPQSFGRLSQKSYMEKQFADLAYSEPLYVKEFYSPARKE